MIEFIIYGIVSVGFGLGAGMDINQAKKEFPGAADPYLAGLVVFAIWPVLLPAFIFTILIRAMKRLG